METRQHNASAAKPKEEYKGMRKQHCQSIQNGISGSLPVGTVCFAFLAGASSSGLHSEKDAVLLGAGV